MKNKEIKLKQKSDEVLVGKVDFYTATKSKPPSF